MYSQVAAQHLDRAWWEKKDIVKASLVPYGEEFYTLDNKAMMVKVFATFEQTGGKVLGQAQLKTVMSKIRGDIRLKVWKANAKVTASRSVSTSRVGHWQPVMQPRLLARSPAALLARVRLPLQGVRGRLVAVGDSVNAAVVVLAFALVKAVEEAEVEKQRRRALEFHRSIEKGVRRGETNITASQSLSEAKARYLRDFRKLDRVIRRRHRKKFNVGTDQKTVVALYEEKELARRRHQQLQQIATSREKTYRKGKFPPRSIARKWLLRTEDLYSRMTIDVAEHIMKHNDYIPCELEELLDRGIYEFSADEALGSEASRYRNTRILAKRRKSKRGAEEMNDSLSESAAKKRRTCIGESDNLSY